MELALACPQCREQVSAIGDQVRYRMYGTREPQRIDAPALSIQRKHLSKLTLSPTSQTRPARSPLSEITRPCADETPSSSSSWANAPHAHHLGLGFRYD